MTKENPNDAEILTEAEQTRINEGILLQALRETIHALNAGTALSAERTAEIQALAETDAAKDPELLAALRTMVGQAKDGNYIPEDYAEKIFALANSSPAIEGMLCNDENSTDEELTEFLMAEFGMRRVEAVKHVERRSYLQRYLPPVAAR